MLGLARLRRRQTWVHWRQARVTHGRQARVNHRLQGWGRHGAQAGSDGWLNRLATSRLAAERVDDEHHRHDERVEENEVAAAAEDERQIKAVAEEPDAEDGLHDPALPLLLVPEDGDDQQSYAAEHQEEAVPGEPGVIGEVEISHRATP